MIKAETVRPLKIDGFWIRGRPPSPAGIRGAYSNRGKFAGVTDSYIPLVRLWLALAVFGCRLFLRFVVFCCVVPL